MGAVIIGTGSCLPKRVLSNHDLEKLVDTNDEWIQSRTGISTRRISGEGEETYRLATTAARNAMAMARVTADEIDLIIVATITSHMVMPSTACFVQKELGANNAFAWDLNAACSGFLYSIDTASKHVLVDRDKTVPNSIQMDHSGTFFTFIALHPVILKLNKPITPVHICLWLVRRFLSML